MRIRITWTAALAALAWAALGGCAQPTGDGDGAAIAREPAPAAAAEPEAEKDLRALVSERKAEAQAAGKYNCCLKHPCDQCMVNMGECPCGDNVRQGKPVCHECKGSWTVGDGAIEGKTADDVTAMQRGGM